ncbi:HAMP domain-containing sensor histidine kinase [Vibrio sp. 99-8-1]|uniref:sensor histidine kinase n=1 Tax=Vibrio sp. 99-8-1 TaxID=2607602 RepID=UPI001493C1C6|nr:HAMP domain-containing sensor histidine kinase [Vibrio sp. 99-8-1]NOI67356.1 HAMP domain-containing histidine kinase [Vibrio sp. 99-8-1]
MKIRPTLRLYFFVSLLAIGTITILVYSALSANAFIDGLNASMRKTMLDVARSSNVEDGEPKYQLTYYIASRWQDLPEEIQNSFETEPVTMYELFTYFEFESMFEPPETGYFLIKAQSEQNELRYVAKMLNRIDFARTKSLGNSPKHEVSLLLYAIGGVVLFAVIIILLIRKIARPIERLKDWAKSLDQNKLQQPAPDFDYAELNMLANIIKNSLNSVQQSLDREQEFLSYASHELRTPIAVTRTNSELLSKMMTVNNNPEKQIEVIERIKRASITMTDLTETLLWLNRSEGKSLVTEHVQLGELTEQLVHDLDYLLEGKSVEVTLSVDTQSFELPVTLCRIVLANLLRNAFQHTSDGRVSVIQTGRSLTITNQNSHALEQNEALGFGLGLKLTKKLIDQHQWQFTSEDIEGGRTVHLTF